MMYKMAEMGGRILQSLSIVVTSTKSAITTKYI